MIEPAWITATGNVWSALLALGLAFGFRDWYFRPRVRLLSGHDEANEMNGRVVTRRLESGETAAFVRLRVDNTGRRTARRVGVQIIQVRRWDADCASWVRTRPELDGRSLQPSNQLRDQNAPIDIFPDSDRIVDLVSVSYWPEDPGPRPVLLEIGHPWPPNRCNILDVGTWRVDLLVVGDNIKAMRYFVTVSFDGEWPTFDGDDIWEHLLVEGPTTHPKRRPGKGTTNRS